jgi:hypothetical protein
MCRVLVLHLKRFKINSSFSAYEKSATHVRCRACSDGSDRVMYAACLHYVRGVLRVRCCLRPLRAAEPEWLCELWLFGSCALRRDMAPMSCDGRLVRTLNGAAGPLEGQGHDRARAGRRVRETRTRAGALD